MVSELALLNMYFLEVLLHVPPPGKQFPARFTLVIFYLQMDALPVVLQDVFRLWTIKLLTAFGTEKPAFFRSEN